MEPGTCPQIPFTSFPSTSFSGVISGGSLQKYGSGKLTLTGANSYSGGTSILGGTLSGSSIANLGTNSNFGTGNFSIANGATLELISTSANTVTFEGSTGTLNIDSTGTAASTRPGTVAEAIDRYERDLEVRGGNVVNATRLRKMVPAEILRKPVALLTTDELRDFRDGLAKRMKRSSVNRACKPLTAALNLAAKRDKRIANRDAWQDGLEAFKDTLRFRR